jgi:hypothetical protein
MGTEMAAGRSQAVLTTPACEQCRQGLLRLLAAAWYSAMRWAAGRALSPCSGLYRAMKKGLCWLD